MLEINKEMVKFIKNLGKLPQPKFFSHVEFICNDKLCIAIYENNKPKFFYKTKTVEYWFYSGFVGIPDSKYESLRISEPSRWSFKIVDVYTPITEKIDKISFVPDNFLYTIENVKIVKL